MVTIEQARQAMRQLGAELNANTEKIGGVLSGPMPMDPSTAPDAPKHPTKVEPKPGNGGGKGGK